MSDNNLRIAISFHDLSVADDAIIRTGIQQVIFEILRSVSRMRASQRVPQVEFVPLHRMPTDTGDFSDSKAWWPLHRNNSAWVLDQTTKELNTHFAELWHPTVCRPDEEFSDEDYYRHLADCDWLLIPGLCEFRHVAHRAKQANPNLKIAVVQYDLVPIRHPYFCTPLMAEWFKKSWIASIEECADLVFCISRHTAIDTVDWFSETDFPTERIVGSLLPGEVPPADLFPESLPLLKRLKLEPGRYFLCLGTLEPRKNLKAAVRGFQKLRKDFARHEAVGNCQMVVVGMKGWGAEDEKLRAELRDVADAILFPGYLEREEIDGLLAHANALVMPSRFEGYGMPISLAHKMGVPTITCVNSSLPEVTQGNSIFVAPQSTSEMALAMFSTLNRSERIPLKNEGREQTLIQWEDLLCNWITLMQNQAA